MIWCSLTLESIASVEWNDLDMLHNDYTMPMPLPGVTVTTPPTSDANPPTPTPTPTPTGTDCLG